METELLQSLDLSHNESHLYLTLVNEGGLPASILAKKAHMSRVVTYQTLDSLELKKLVFRKNPTKSGVLWFYPTHPRTLLERANIMKTAAETTERTIAESLGTLVSQYNSHQGLPNVQFYEGISGLQNLYDDIVETGSDILLLRSPFDNDHPEFKSMVGNQIAAQIREDIHTRAIVPRYDKPNRVSLKQQDITNLVERREYDLARFQLPAQIIIYDNKVGITQFTSGSATTIIESAAVATSFRILFEIFWSHASVAE